MINVVAMEPVFGETRFWIRYGGTIISTLGMIAIFRSIIDFNAALMGIAGIQHEARNEMYPTL